MFSMLYVAMRQIHEAKKDNYAYRGLHVWSLRAFPVIYRES